MQILPAMGFHRRTPRSILYGPRRYGGQSLMNLYTEQGISGIKTLIGQLQSHNEVSRLLRILLSFIQMIAGTRAHYLRKCSPPLPHVPFLWLEHLRTFLSTFQGSLIIPDIWSPIPPRKNDSFLMDSMLQVTGNDSPTPFELHQFNECRLYRHAIFLSCITTPDGCYITNKFLTGHHQIKSKWRWPYLPFRPPRYWRTWRRWLNRLFSTSSSNLPRNAKTIHINKSYQLGTYKIPPHHTNHDWHYSPSTKKGVSHIG